MSEVKLREWYIAKGGYNVAGTSISLAVEIQHDTAVSTPENNYHVVEKSAYEILQKELAELKWRMEGLEK